MALSTRSEICDECPFRRLAMAGWLGSNDPETFANIATNGPVSVACHKMVDQTLTGATWTQSEASAPRCRGALTLIRNECKRPGNPELLALLTDVAQDNQTVFSHRLQFLDHHESSPVKSWEL